MTIATQPGGGGSAKGMLEAAGDKLSELVGDTGEERQPSRRGRRGEG